MIKSPDLLRNAYTSYFRFNNARTLSTNLPSELKIADLPELTSYIDPTRRYDNQLIIHRSSAAAQIEDILECYHEDTPPEISVEPDAVAYNLSKVLIGCEYRPSYSHEFLVMDIGTYSPVGFKDGVRVEMLSVERADEFLALLKTSGLSCSDETWQAKRHLYCTEVFRCFVAFVGDIPCAWATSFIDEKTATLANAYTQEKYRGRGCQTALLHARIQDAEKLGVGYLLTDVMPKTVSASNCKAVGFLTETIRTVWEKAN
ncbi:hypothetical protein EDC56_0501 [Sinobacterium caligoides]|uniref:N-acetyltransferase domain-containing protein n=1 Tax=Sinobacterium caligoides TaxID=933926 RepID=A0A3N2DYR1_9GAMM|nr:GNAT family N-acetyltransferase [Sinobacterium caligoides]ROS04983.1 hypothetical protein EDC56_0501 [Sinobacterium caligoides]